MHRRRGSLKFIQLLKGIIMYLLNGTRQAQRTVLAAGLPFAGGIAIRAKVVNPKKLTFVADVDYTTGDVVTPLVTITPSDETGKVKVFGNVDDLIKWIDGAFQGVTSIQMVVEDFDLVAKPVVVPTDPVAAAGKQKAKVVKYKTFSQARLTDAMAKTSAAAALGWNLLTAHPALQANYADLLKNEQTVQAYVTFYTAEIARLTLITG